jgi:hypothetical protein
MERFSAENLLSNDFENLPTIKIVGCEIEAVRWMASFFLTSKLLIQGQVNPPPIFFVIKF